MAVSITCPRDFSSASISEILNQASDDVLFLADPRIRVEPGSGMFERMSRAIQDSKAGMAYSDAHDHPRIDYQRGSIRDNFDFGPILAISTERARQVWQGGGTRWAGLYDLRLRLSEKFPLVHIAEPLYGASVADSRPSGEQQFDYVDPRNRDYQIEMEEIATAHLRRTGAWLAPQFREVPRSNERFPVEASVIIPVRNRERTIRDAVQSVLSQATGFTFNVIVIDNHSSDRTTEILL